MDIPNDACELVEAYECPICGTIHAEQKEVSKCYNACAKARARERLPKVPSSWSSALTDKLKGNKASGSTAKVATKALQILNEVFNDLNVALSTELVNVAVSGFETRTPPDVAQSRPELLTFKLAIRLSAHLDKAEWSSVQWTMQQGEALLSHFTPIYPELGITGPAIQVKLPIKDMLTQALSAFGFQRLKWSDQATDEGLSVVLHLSAQGVNTSGVCAEAASLIEEAISDWNTATTQLAELEQALKTSVENTLVELGAEATLATIDAEIQAIEAQLCEAKTRKKAYLLDVGKALLPLEQQAAKDMETVVGKQFAKVSQYNISVPLPRPPALGYGVLRPFLVYAPALIRF